MSNPPQIDVRHGYQPPATGLATAGQDGFVLFLLTMSFRDSVL